MKSNLEVCPHCRRDFKVRVSEDIGFYAHWVGNYFLIDVVLILSEARSWFVLYREVYVVESKKRGLSARDRKDFNVKTQKRLAGK